MATSAVLLADANGRLAKKGFGNDWAIYCYWQISPGTSVLSTRWDFIAKHGDKVKDKTNILRCINVSDEVMKLYRF